MTVSCLALLASAPAPGIEGISTFFASPREKSASEKFVRVTDFSSPRLVGWPLS